MLPSGHVVSHDGYMSQGDNSYPPNIDANLVVEGIAPNSTVEIEIISLDLYIHPRKLCSDYLEIVGVSRKPMGQQLEKICPRNSGKDNIGSEIVYTLAENIVFRFVSDAYNDRHGGFMLRYNVIDFDPDYVGNTAKSTTTPALKADNSTLAIGNITVESSTISRSEEHTSELQSHVRISYAVFCLKKKKKNKNTARAYSCTTDTQ